MNKLTINDLVTHVRKYDESFQILGTDDGWLPGNKEKNFASMLYLPKLTHVSIKGCSCLDVGCGSGDLSRLLRNEGTADYIGIDIYRTALEKAKKKYPRERFITGDFLAYKFKKNFDYIFCSGALTVKLVNDDNYDYLAAMVKKMWHLSNIGLVFNVLTDNETIADDELFFYNTSRVKNICEKITSTAKIFTKKSEGVKQIHVYLYR